MPLCAGIYTKRVMYVAKRTDGNQTEIVEGLRKLGYSVAITSMMGKGFPDIVVAKDFKTMLVEIKDPSQPPSKRKLTADELKFHAKWNDIVIVAETIHDITKNFI